MIVLDDADLDAAVNAAAFGAFMNQGQICMSTERIVVDQKVADEFVKRLSAKAAALPLRDPSHWARLCLARWWTRASANKISALIEDAVQKGARITQEASVVAR